MSDFIEQDAHFKYPALNSLFLFRVNETTHNRDAMCRHCKETWRKAKTNRLVHHFKDCPGSDPEKVEELKAQVTQAETTSSGQHSQSDQILKGA